MMDLRDLSLETQGLLLDKEIVFFFPVSQGIDYLQNLLIILNEDLVKPRTIHVIIFDGVTQRSRSHIWTKGEQRYRIWCAVQTIEKFNSINPGFVTYELHSLKSLFKKPKKIKRLIDLKANFKEDAAVYNSIRSVLASNHTRSALNDYPVKKFQKVIFNYLSDYKNSQAVVERVVSRNMSGNVTYIFLNGRHPSQAAIRSTLEKSNLKFLTFDWGEPGGKRILLENFQIQESLELQSYWIRIRKEYSLDEVNLARDFSLRWLKAQATSSHVNHYLTDVPIAESLIDRSEGMKLAVIFSSSADEEIFNLPENSNGWVDQVHALRATSDFLSMNGFKVIVRIHPNASNKSWLDLARLVKSLEEAKVSYILPWDKTSSYELIHKADLVGTWISRIGLEAACIGKPTFYLGIGPYAKAARIQTIDPCNLKTLLTLDLNPEDFDEKLITIFQIYNYGVDVEQFSNSPFIQETSITRIVDFNRMKSIELIFYRLGKVLNRINLLRLPIFGQFGIPNMLLKLLPAFARGKFGPILQSAYLKISILFLLKEI